MGPPHWLLLATLAAAVVLSTAQIDGINLFNPSEDPPKQHAALLKLLSTVGSGALLKQANASLDIEGYPGSNAWGSANTSLCTWVGVGCCGPTLTNELPLCMHGQQSVSSLSLAATNLEGTLPDIFDDLPDLQLLDVSYNRGRPLRLCMHLCLCSAALQQYTLSCSPSCRAGVGCLARFRTQLPFVLCSLTQACMTAACTATAFAPIPTCACVTRGPSCLTSVQACAAPCLMALAGCQCCGCWTLSARAWPATPQRCRRQHAHCLAG
jgi:hypothetical protein